MVFILFYLLSLSPFFFLLIFVPICVFMHLTFSSPKFSFSFLLSLFPLSVSFARFLFLSYFPYSYADLFFLLYFFIKSSLRRGKCLCWIGFLDKIWIFYVTKMLKEAELKNGMPCTWIFFFHFQFVKVRDLAKNIFFNYQFLIWIIK